MSYGKNGKRSIKRTNERNKGRKNNSGNYVGLGTDNVAMEERVASEKRDAAKITKGLFKRKSTK